MLHCHAPQARHHLAFSFWPDVNEAQVRNNLRQMLHQLRHALPNAEQFLQADANTEQWLPNAPFRLDVAEFESTVTQATVGRSSDRQAICHTLQTAIDWYRGDLLPSCYDDWIAPERERLHQQAMQTLQQLVQLREELRDYRAALAAARRLLQLDPLEEATYLSLVRLHALNDDRVGALRLYHDCVTILQRELNVDPGDAIQSAYQQLFHHTAQPTTPPSRVGALPLIGRQPEWEHSISPGDHYCAEPASQSLGTARSSQLGKVVATCRESARSASMVGGHLCMVYGRL